MADIIHLVTECFGCGHDCEPGNEFGECYEYCDPCAEELGRQADAMRDADGIPIVVVPDETEAAQAWAAEMPAEALILADPGGAWIDAVKASVGGSPDGVMLLVLDRYVAPRAVSIAAEAGGLIAPLEATEWLRFLALECPECGGEVAWPD